MLIESLIKTKTIKSNLKRINLVVDTKFYSNNSNFIKM